MLFCNVSPKPAAIISQTKLQTIIFAKCFQATLLHVEKCELAIVLLVLKMEFLIDQMTLT